LHLGCSVTLTARDPWPRCWAPATSPGLPHTHEHGSCREHNKTWYAASCDWPTPPGFSSFLPFHSTLCDTLLPQEPVTFPRTRLPQHPLSFPSSLLLFIPTSSKHLLPSVTHTLPSIPISINSNQDARFKQVAWRRRPHGLEAALPSDVNGTRPGYVLHRVGQLSAPGCVIYQGFRL
jgi:hypothetical protein